MSGRTGYDCQQSSHDGTEPRHVASKRIRCCHRQILEATSGALLATRFSRYVTCQASNPLRCAVALSPIGCACLALREIAPDHGQWRCGTCSSI